MKLKTWLDTIERNIPKGYTILSPGWPDAWHGITHSAYIDMAITALEDLDDGADIPQFPTFENWKRDQRDNEELGNLGFSFEELGNIGFSFDDCDLCGDLPGERYAATALPPNPSENHDYVALSVCRGCLCYIANGDVPDWLEGENDR